MFAIRPIRQREPTTLMFAIDRNKRVLGVCLGERALSVAELTPDDTPRRTAQAVEFPYPPAVGLEQGDVLGAALAAFLQQHAFTTRAAVVGVPARWLILKPHELPPADRQTASDILWLQATASIRPELGPMVFDYAGRSSESASSSLLLMALQRTWLDRIQSVCQAAGLKLLAVTPVGCALVNAGAAAGARSILSIRREAAELITHDGQSTQSIRHIGSAAALEPLISQLRRAGEMRTIEPTEGLVLWDEVGLEPAALQALQAAVAAPIAHGDLAMLGVNGPAARGAIAASALALALTASRGRRPEVDFLHPAIAPPRAAHPALRTAGLAAAALLVLLALAAALIDAFSLRREVARADEQLARLAPALRIARPFVAGMGAIELFQAGHPRYLACLRDLTVALPVDGQTSFTSFKLDANLKGEIAGRSAGDRGALALVDAMSASRRFANLNRKLDSRVAIAGPGGAAGGGANELTFRLTFTYVPAGR